MKLTQELLQQMGFHNHNYATGRYYEGLTNQENLQARGYPKPLRMTFHQAKQSGLKVKKGEKGTKIVHRKIREKETRKGLKKIPCIKKYTVFNIDQCEDVNTVEQQGSTLQTGVVSGYADELYEIDFQERQATRCKDCGYSVNDIRTDDDRPCYCRECSVHGDMIQLRK